MTKPSSADPRSEVVYWLPLSGALAHFEVERSELVAAVRSGALRSRRILRGEDLVVALSSTELLVHYPRREKPLQASSRPLAGSYETEQSLREQAAELARVQGRLAAAEKIERSMQRYADRLEGELAKVRQEALTLARALGRAEQLAASNAAEMQRLQAPEPRKRRRLFGRR